MEFIIMPVPGGKTNRVFDNTNIYMEPEFDPVIGIVGGMGPQAGLALFNSIMRQTNAATDQQHLSTILMSFPRHIVDRTAFLEGVTDINPGFSIAAVIQKLERAGASIAGISCNTSHCPRIFEIIVRELRKQNSSIQLLNMPLETCACIRERYPSPAYRIDDDQRYLPNGNLQ